MHELQSLFSNAQDSSKTLHPFAAGGHNHLPRDPAGAVAGWKPSGQGDVFRRGDPAESCRFLSLLSKFTLV